MDDCLDKLVSIAGPPLDGGMLQEQVLPDSDPAVVAPVD
jgi:hypothetical protein